MWEKPFALNDLHGFPIFFNLFFTKSENLLELEEFILWMNITCFLIILTSIADRIIEIIEKTEIRVQIIYTERVLDLNIKYKRRF